RREESPPSSRDGATIRKMSIPCATGSPSRRRARPRGCINSLRRKTPQKPSVAPNARFAGSRSVPGLGHPAGTAQKSADRAKPVEHASVPDIVGLGAHGLTDPELGPGLALDTPKESKRCPVEVDQSDREGNLGLHAEGRAGEDGAESVKMAGFREVDPLELFLMALGTRGPRWPVERAVPGAASRGQAAGPQSVVETVQPRLVRGLEGEEVEEERSLLERLGGFRDRFRFRRSRRGTFRRGRHRLPHAPPVPDLGAHAAPPRW